MTEQENDFLSNVPLISETALLCLRFPDFACLSY